MDIGRIDAAPVPELRTDPVSPVGRRSADVRQDHAVAGRREEDHLDVRGRSPRSQRAAMDVDDRGKWRGARARRGSDPDVDRAAAPRCLNDMHLGHLERPLPTRPERGAGPCRPARWCLGPIIKAHGHEFHRARAVRAEEGDGLGSDRDRMRHAVGRRECAAVDR